jgi:hypothetical protein
MPQSSNNILAGIGNPPTTKSNNAFAAPIVIGGGGPPTGTIQWSMAADLDYTTCASSGPYTAPGTVTVGGGLPDLTLATDNPGTYSVTPTAGVGIALSSTGTARPYVSFIPNWAGLGIDPLGPEGFYVEIVVSSPVQAASSFFSSMVGNAANPNGSGSGIGGRSINSAGTRQLICRSVSLGTAELGPLISSSVGSDFPTITFLGGFFPGEMIGSSIGTAPPASLAGYTVYRDSFAKTPMTTTWGLSPGHVSLLFGGANISGTITRIRIWKRIVA